MRRNSPFERASEFRPDDPIARLIVHYFHPCDFVFRDYKRVARALARQKQLTKWRASQEISYLRLWLAMLYAVGEGFVELGLNDPEVNALLQNPALERLRKLRNGTFHYQRSHEKLTQFFLQSGHIEWAETLHSAFDNFFREYRIEQTVKNLMMKPPT